MSEQVPERKKPSCDADQLAKAIVDNATGDVKDREPTSEEQGKGPAAVSIARPGGKKGGEARAQSMTPELRAEMV